MLVCPLAPTPQLNIVQNTGWVRICYFHNVHYNSLTSHFVLFFFYFFIIKYIYFISSKIISEFLIMLVSSDFAIMIHRILNYLHYTSYQLLYNIFVFIYLFQVTKILILVLVIVGESTKLDRVKNKYKWNEEVQLCSPHINYLVDIICDSDFSGNNFFFVQY